MDTPDLKTSPNPSNSAAESNPAIVNSTTTDLLRAPSCVDEIGVERKIVVGIIEGAVDAGEGVELKDEEGTDVKLCDVGAGVELDIVVAWAVVVSAPAPAVLELLPDEYGIELHVVGAGVLDDDAAGVLPPLVPGADVLPILPSAVVVSAPAPAMVADVVKGVSVEKEEENTVVVEDEAMTLVGEVSVGEAVVKIPVVRAAVVDELAAGGAI